MTGEGDGAVEWPPFPSVLLGAGRWRSVVKILQQRGTKESQKLANQISGQIDQNAIEIAQRAQPVNGPLVPARGSAPMPQGQTRGPNSGSEGSLSPSREDHSSRSVRSDG